MMAKKKIGIFAIIFSLIAVVIGVGVFFIYNNNRGLTRIDNFGDYYYNVPDETKRIIFASLYSTISVNNVIDIPSDGAVVRDNVPQLYSYNSSYSGFVGRFIVDIPKIQQSYLVEFNYAEDPEKSLGGYAALIYCLEESEMIYPDFNCQENLPFYNSVRGSSIYE